jgi:rhamnulokinase
MGLWLVQECRRAWGSPPYAELVRLAETAPAGGPLFDPDLPELLAPGDMPARIAAALTAPGAVNERPVILRAIFESLACKYRFVLGEIEDVTGAPIDTVHVIGGGANNEFLCRLTANITGRFVLAGPVEAAALGNLLVQLHAFGEVGSLAEMRELVRRSTGVRAYEPDGDERWAALYERFSTLVEKEVVTR